MMPATAVLSWRLLRGGGRHGLVSTVLTLAAVAVSTGLLLLSVSMLHGLTERADRSAWRSASESKHPTATQVVSTDVVRGRSLAVVDLAPVAGQTPPVPPGMSRFPRPGEVWVSPALATLLTELPADELARRFPQPTPTGLLGKDAVVAADELVAVVGRSASDPAISAVPGFGGSGSGPVGVAAFPRTDPDGYTAAWVGGFAVVLVAVPLLVLMGAAARLSVARRDQRLAAMRLVGATPRQVRLMTAAETMLTAVAGAALGGVLYLLGIPLMARASIGGTWFASDLWVGHVAVAVVLALVPVLVGVSALIGLRRVVISPLGVVRRQTPPKLRAVRILFFLAPPAAAASLITPQTALLLGLPLLALSFLGIPILGPWVVQLLGRLTARVARRPGLLLAARRLVDDPRSGWRMVSGIALTGFVAGFLAMFTANVDGLTGADANRLTITAPAARGEAVAGQARDRLRARGVPATVTVEEADRSVDGVSPARDLTVQVSGGPADVDRARTALIGLVPGGTGAIQSAEPDPLLAYVRPAALFVLCVNFLVAATSAGITAASSVLDRRQTYGLLRLAGTPLKVLDKARRWETLLPLAVMGGGSILTGMFMAAVFNPGGISGSGVAVLVGCVGVGFAAVLGASSLSRPLLRAVTADPTPRPD